MTDRWASPSGFDQFLIRCDHSAAIRAVKRTPTLTGSGEARRAFGYRLVGKAYIPPDRQDAIQSRPEASRAALTG